MFALILIFFAISLAIFSVTVTIVTRCNQLGIDPKELDDRFDVYFAMKLSGCVTIVWLAVIFALLTGHVSVQPLM